MNNLTLLSLVALLIVLAMPSAFAIDADQDGISDEDDVCLGTDPNDLIVHVQDNFEHAGCSCDQIFEIYGRDNPCVNIVCRGRALQLIFYPKYDPYLDCPDDSCKDTTFYDYPVDGKGSCVNGRPVEKNCEPVLYENSVSCGYNPSSDNASFGVMPKLSGDVNTLFLTHAQLSYEVLPPVLTEDRTLTSLMLFDGNELKVAKLELFENGMLIPAEEFCDENEDGKLFCSSSWDISVSEEGKRQLSLSIYYDSGEGSIVSDTQLIEFEVPLASHTELDVETSIVGFSLPLSDSEVDFIEEVYELLLERGFVHSYDLDGVVDSIEKTGEHVVVTKSRDITSEGTSYTINVRPKAPLEGLTIIENIPKEVAAHVNDLRFDPAPTLVLKADPMVMWHFASVDERVSINYETDTYTEEEGTTIIRAHNITVSSTPWHIILPLLLIPILSLSIIMINKRNKPRL